MYYGIMFCLVIPYMVVTFFSACLLIQLFRSHHTFLVSVKEESSSSHSIHTPHFLKIHLRMSVTFLILSWV